MEKELFFKLAKEAKKARIRVCVTARFSGGEGEETVTEAAVVGVDRRRGVQFGTEAFYIGTGEIESRAGLATIGRVDSSLPVYFRLKSDEVVSLEYA